MKTALYNRHVALGAKMSTFAGWEMPIQYKGVIAEHQAVREAVGLFDISHMGRIAIRGEGAEPLVDFLSTNRIGGKEAGSAAYTVWCYENGGCVDDLIVYKIDSSHFFVIANASNRNKDLVHLDTYSDKQFDVEISEAFEKEGILALQGPHASHLLSSLIPEAEGLKTMHFFFLPHEGLFISRTGYTGSGGYEISASNNIVKELWDVFLKIGEHWGLLPCGLGARDTLRLEMGYALYGHEINDMIAPTESVSAWSVKWDKPLFLGKEALVKLEESGQKRRAYGISLLDKGVARQGCEVFLGNERIGVATSGSFSPSLGRSIALILVRTPLERGVEVFIKVRETLLRAQVEELPFVRKKT